MVDESKVTMQISQPYYSRVRLHTGKPSCQGPCRALDDVGVVWFPLTHFLDIKICGIPSIHNDQRTGEARPDLTGPKLLAVVFRVQARASHIAEEGFVKMVS
jgi:hypothetical protein